MNCGELAELMRIEWENLRTGKTNRLPGRVDSMLELDADTARFLDESCEIFAASREWPSMDKKCNLMLRQRLVFARKFALSFDGDSLPTHGPSEQKAIEFLLISSWHLRARPLLAEGGGGWFETY